MTKKIFHSIFLVAVVVFFACLAFIMGVLYEYYGTVQEKQLATELTLAVKGVEQNGMDYLEGFPGEQLRITWVDETGRVLFDSQTNAAGMENHAEREEIRDALVNGTGKSSRYSLTLTEQTIYCAQKLTDGSVLRVSSSRLTALSLILSMLQPIAVVIFIALVISFVLANSLSRKIVKPLEALNLEEPLSNETYDELAPILKRLESQHRQIRSQKAELNERRKEFAAVTGSMNEGLILLNDKGIILSINPAARAFLGGRKDHSGAAVDGMSALKADSGAIVDYSELVRDYTGADFLSIERDHEVSVMIEAAKTDGKAELQISRGSREYQLSASCVGTDGSPSGVVILIVDVTEKVFAERNRREFTANVSHELKTPLQSILGSAELMENGLVKPEDVPQFTGRIRFEASRLVTLIEDIIRLSQLDEKADMPTEEIELKELAKEELSALTLAADDKHVELELEGREVIINGVRPLLHEIIFNLCDNAVKYNVDGGKVTVTIGEDSENAENAGNAGNAGKAENAENAVIKVSDTGIGIPKDAQARIFERFYRVDKSHSKRIGGTGLGLSIVKHAVQYMDGSISVVSEPGVGTTVTVKLPKKLYEI